MTPDLVVVQASSRSWSGGPDFCMNLVEGKPAVTWTVETARRMWPDVEVIVAAPAFDAGGGLDSLAKGGVRVTYSHDASPLDRLLDAARGFPDAALLVRVDGLHLGWRPALARQLLELAAAATLDRAKAVDDYPIQLTADVYRVGALRRLAKVLGPDDGIYRVHPKYAMVRRADVFSVARVEPTEEVSMATLTALRERCRAVYTEGRLEVNARSIAAGDQLSFHYELALERIDQKKEMPDGTPRVLDAACGPGYGAVKLATRGLDVVAADLDAPTIAAAQKMHTAIDGALHLEFRVEDVTALSFADESFDIVTSFETLEHVPPEPYFRELHRVLGAGGRLMLSTPQNRLGVVPVNPQHRREYSLEELLELAAPLFEPVEVLGIKQGRVVIPGEDLGQNTFAVFRRRSLG